jgi:bifunctional DNA-binding transcriptional regulator/antitoxin component of YhaV-PrlF toxin-antitoxin module
MVGATKRSRSSNVVIKLGASPTRTGSRYLVTVPKQYVEILGWSKGDYLKVVIIEHEVEGKRYKGIFYFKVF